MKKKLSFVIILICQSIFCQEYSFDYASTYEYRVLENETVIAKFITLANSKTEDYVLRINIENDEIRYCSLLDFSKNKEYQINNFNKNLEANNNLIIEKAKSLKIIDCDNFENKYNIEYVKINGVDVIKIKRYKNKKKNKIITESILYTKPSDITKNQHYSFPTLIFPLRCNKFKLNTDEVITEASFFEDNKELHFYKLIDFKQIDLKIKI